MRAKVRKRDFLSLYVFPFRGTKYLSQGKMLKTGYHKFNKNQIKKKEINKKGSRTKDR